MSDRSDEIRRRTEARVYVEGLLMGCLLAAVGLPAFCVIIYTIWVTHVG